MTGLFVNSPLNIAFRFEQELENALRTGKDIASVMSFFAKKPLPELIPTQSIFPQNAPPGIKNGKGMVGIVHVLGFLQRAESYWSTSYEGIARQIREFDNNPDVMATVLKVHSPGGTSDGNYIAADAVAGAKKPVLAHTGYCFSAAYMTACPADMIVLDNQAASSIGSIGSLYIHSNYSKQLEQDGVKMTIFRAKGSEKKALVNGIEELTPELEQKIQSMVNDCRNEFVGYVNRGRRGKIKSDALTGDEFNRNEALSLGLADATGSFQWTLQEAVRMAVQR